jgi:hypothetical protein
MKRTTKFRSLVLVPLLAAAGIGAVLASGAMRSTEADAAPPPTPPGFPALSATIPSDIPGGAGKATISSAATFAWQEFIALNWPAKAQTGAPLTRGQANTAQKFGSDAPAQPVVWETMRSKVETFPGVGNPPGYAPTAPDFGYDHTPVYTYGTRTKTASPIGKLQNNPGGPPLVVAPCPGQTTPAMPAFVNLDETTQIGEDSMFAGIVPPAATQSNGQPQLIRFLAKGNRAFYRYVAANQYWYHGKAYTTAQLNFAAAAQNNRYPAPQPTLNLPAGTILVKAAWRTLAPNEHASDFHMKTVRYYENIGTVAAPSICYREQAWALIALHIIQKTPTAPYFIYATFEYASNILTPGGTPVENQDGGLNPNPPSDGTTPPGAYFDLDGKFYSPDFPKGTTTIKPPSGATLPIVLAAGDYCNIGAATTPVQNARTYYQNFAFGSPQFGNALPTSSNPNQGFCVNKRYFNIPDPIVQANAAAHAALAAYGAPALWQNYKLVNVQWQPFNTADIDTTGVNTARLAATYYQSNSVVETDNTLQQFFGGLTFTGLKSAYETNSDGVTQLSQPAHNIYLPPSGVTPIQSFTRYNMGGCMGCHGRAQQAGDDFSFTLRGGPVSEPETPGVADVVRLKELRRGLTGSVLQ